MQILKMNRRTRPGRFPVLQETHLGWILCGQYHQPTCSKEPQQSSNSLFLRTDVNLENQIRAFWHLEEVTQLVHSPQERECELHFQDHTTRLDSGRYVVELPMIKEHNPLGKSKQNAIHRLHLLERLERNEILRHSASFLHGQEYVGS
jgi:hypothetical protein